MFGWRTSYKKVIERLALDAMVFDPMQAPGLAPSSKEETGHTYNSLEGTAAILFLTHRALGVVGDSEQFSKARHYLAGVFLSALERQYSKDEMQSRVVPLLERRSTEYASILGGAGDPGAQLRQLGRAMIGRFVEDDIDDTKKGRATLFLLEKLMIEPGKKLKASNEAGKIRW